MKRLALAMALIAFPAAAQDYSPTITAAPGGECTCSRDGKTWPCRQARGAPGGSILAVNLCHGGGYQLTCPDDPKAVCEYTMSPPVCLEPPLTPVCWAADEPK